MDILFVLDEPIEESSHMYTQPGQLINSLPGEVKWTK